MATIDITEAPFDTTVIAVHSHRYSVEGKRPADVMAAATHDLTACIADSDDQMPSNPADLISAVIDQESGGMYFAWSEETDGDSKPWSSKAENIETHYVHIYQLDGDAASIENVRVLLDAAERDASAFADANELEYSSDIIGVNFTNGGFTAAWSTEVE